MLDRVYPRYYDAMKHMNQTCASDDTHITLTLNINSLQSLTSMLNMITAEVGEPTVTLEYEYNIDPIRYIRDKQMITVNQQKIIELKYGNHSIQVTMFTEDTSDLKDIQAFYSVSVIMKQEYTVPSRHDSSVNYQYSFKHIWRASSFERAQAKALEHPNEPDTLVLELTTDLRDKPMVFVRLLAKIEDFIYDPLVNKYLIE